MKNEQYTNSRAQGSGLAPRLTGSRANIISKTVRRIISLMVMMLLLSTIAWGQDAFIEQVFSPGVEHNEAVKKFGIKYVTGQFTAEQQLLENPGSSNQSVIDLQGDFNTAILSQLGEGHTGVMNVQGNFNETSLSQQGSGLLSVMNLQGDYNNLSLDQQGTDFGAMFDMVGDNMDYSATQFQAGNSGRYHFQLKPQTGTGQPTININTTRNYLPIIIKGN